MKGQLSEETRRVLEGLPEEAKRELEAWMREALVAIAGSAGSGALAPWPARLQSLMELRAATVESWIRELRKMMEPRDPNGHLGARE